MDKLIIEDVIAQHADEAAFLWHRRDTAVRSPRFTLRQLTALDDQLEAHIDGLRVAGEAGWEICAAAVASGDATEVFVAGVLAVEDSKTSRLEQLCERGAPAIDNPRALISAMGWAPKDVAQKKIEWFLASGSPTLRSVGIGAAAAHRVHPGAGLVHALNDIEASVRSRALRAVGELGIVEFEPRVRAQLSAAEPECRFCAACSSARLTKDPSATAVLKSFVEAGGDYSEAAARIAPRIMEGFTAKGWLREMPSIRAAIIACGSAGDPCNLEHILEYLPKPPLARVAGEAFSMITGVDLARMGLVPDRPPESDSCPTEDPEDENVGTDPDEDLPWPDADRVARWWSANANSFEEGTRYLAGKPIQRDWLLEVLRTKPQRQRAAAALEIGLIEPAEPLLEVRAPGRRQELLLQLQLRRM